MGNNSANSLTELVFDIEVQTEVRFFGALSQQDGVDVLGASQVQLFGNGLDIQYSTGGLGGVNEFDFFHRLTLTPGLYELQISSFSEIDGAGPNTISPTVTTSVVLATVPEPNIVGTLGLLLPCLLRRKRS